VEFRLNHRKIVRVEGTAMREADTLVVWKLDRLGRSVKGLVNLVNELEAQKVHFQSITDGVDTRRPPGASFLT
jgi:DNA invertase Pin-like site-specific DNA recombinase